MAISNPPPQAAPLGSRHLWTKNPSLLWFTYILHIYPYLVSIHMPIYVHTYYSFQIMSLQTTQTQKSSNDRMPTGIMLLSMWKVTLCTCECDHSKTTTYCPHSHNRCRQTRNVCYSFCCSVVCCPPQSRLFILMNVNILVQKCHLIALFTKLSVEQTFDVS